eukprot:403356254
MLYKVDPMGYFGRVQKVSRGPWFQESMVEDDGLDFYYAYPSADGLTYLLSNNIPIQDRERLQRLYDSFNRNRFLAWFTGVWVGAEVVSRMACFKKMAIGWRLLSLAGTAWSVKTAIQFYNGLHYGPLFSAYFRKYQGSAKQDLFEISDRKREYYNIDTTQYMNYTNEDLGHDYHANHGPQPDGEALDSTWLVEVDKFLRGEENKLKEHKFFVNYQYEYLDKSYPTAEAAHELFHKKPAPAKRIF